MLGMGKNTVEIIIAAKDRTSAAFTKVNTRMKTMSGTTGKLQSSMGGLSSKMSALATSMNPVAIAAGAAAIALATMGGAAIKASLDFEKASATIRVGTGATGEALAGLEESFKTVYTAVPASTEDAATAIADLNTRLGLTGEPLEALATQFLNLSRITGTDVSSAISSATRVMHDFAVSSEEQSGALDYLFKVSQSTGIGMTNLANNMTRYGGVMRQMGFDINTSAALLGKFEKEGVNLELVLSSLRMGLANFARAGEEPVEALKRVISEIQGMGSAADRNLKAIEIFGARSGPDMAAAIYEGRFSIEELMATLEASGETINKAAADTMTFGDKWTLFKNKIMTAIAPIGDVITNVLGTALSGLGTAFGVLQKIAGPAIDIIFIKFKMLHSFLEGLFGPILAALAPLKGSFDGISGSVSKLNIVFKVVSDIVTILTGVAKMLGTAIGNLVAMALTPLVAKLKDAIDMLTAFYNKLGPIKDLIEGVKGVGRGGLEWISNLADSFKETVLPIEEVTSATEEAASALEALNNIEPKAPKAFVDAWALAIKSFQEGTGSYKEAIGGIEEKITKLTEEWMTASDKRKTAIEKEVELIKREKETLEVLKQTAEDALSSTAKETQKTTEKMEEFNVSIGDTTIEFKGMASEVVKNADAYDKLQRSARTLIDLDWTTFTEFEAALPRIEAGILNMESGFVGLKDILEENIDELENVKLAVIDIAEIAAPFLEKGFLDGIDSIGNFADALSDAGGAINTFAGLQDVSIDGCINFSLHVREMVSALEILEGQMEDLVPAFGDMDILIKDILRSFVSETESLTKGSPLFEFLERGFETWTKKGGYHIDKYYGMLKILEDAFYDVGLSAESAGAFMYEHFDILNQMAKESENADEFIQRVAESEIFLGIEVDIVTASLSKQTGQLKKITDALQPYLEFMRTLNELAALSTISTEELNAGLNSINDTLVNLGTALRGFDLRSAMEALFAPDTGAAKGFMDVMIDYNADFGLFAATLARVTEVIQNLSVAMENAAGMVVISSKEMEAAMRLIPAQLEEIETFLRTDLWGQIVAMLFAVNVEWTKFEDILEDTSFSTVISTISNLIGVMNSMKDTFSDVSAQVVISSKEMEEAMTLIPAQLEELEKFLMTDLWGQIVTMIFAVGVQWKNDAKIIDDSMPSFNAAVDTVSTLASKVLTLSASLKELKDMSVLSMRDIDEALKAIPVFLDRFVDALRLNMYDIKESLKDLDVEWQKHAEEMKETMPSYEASTEAISKLVGSFVSLHSALKSLSEMGTISSITFDKGFSSLVESISNFAVSLANNVDDLIYSLQKLRVVWVENEAVLFPLIRDFAIITDNLYGVAHNANRMAKEFNDLSKNAGTLEEGFKSLIEFINQVVDSTEEFYTPAAAAELAGFIEDVGAVIQSFYDLEIKLKGAMEKIRLAIGSAVDNIEGKISSLSSLSESAYWWGANMMGSYINGIYSMSTTLREALESHAGMVESYLGTYSNAKTGPLSHLDEWPRNLVQSYSAGIESEMSTLNSSFASMFAGPVSVGAGGGSRTVYLNVTQHIGSQADADYSAEALQRVLTRHEVM